jgi:hypothetical protein
MIQSLSWSFTLKNKEPLSPEIDVLPEGKSFPIKLSYLWGVVFFLLLASSLILGTYFSPILDRHDSSGTRAQSLSEIDELRDHIKSLKEENLYQQNLIEDLKSKAGAAQASAAGISALKRAFKENATLTFLILKLNQSLKTGDPYEDLTPLFDTLSDGIKERPEIIFFLKNSFSGIPSRESILRTLKESKTMEEDSSKPGIWKKILKFFHSLAKGKDSEDTGFKYLKHLLREDKIGQALSFSEKAFPSYTLLMEKLHIRLKAQQSLKGLESFSFNSLRDV